ncbi:MAG: copper chaperone PCu(A)C [Microbacteriaceae bacterium]
MMQKTSRSLLGLAICLSLSFGAIACSSGPNDETNPTSSERPTSSHEHGSLIIEDAWVKAAEDGMSAAFAIIKNDSDVDVTITKASSSAATTIELHTTVLNSDGQMVMREVQDGFVIPARGKYLLEPGGNHFMLMQLTTPLNAGDSVSFTITLTNGLEQHFTAPVKDYAGANEQYETGGHEHGDHEHDGHGG